MKPLFAGLTVAVTASTLMACSSATAWLPDVGSWFTSENQVIVSEVASASQCRATGKEASLKLLRDGAAVKAWEASRGLSLTGRTELPKGPYVAIDLGSRPTAGYGIAVSRQAGLRDDVLVLKATVFEPQPGAITAQVITSPCALVRIPVVDFKSMRLIDQSGRPLARLDETSAAR